MIFINVRFRNLIFYASIVAFCWVIPSYAQDGEGIIQRYRKALEMNPDDMDARYVLGIALLREKAYNEAVLHLQKVYPSRAGEAEMNYNMGLAYAGNGELGKAFKHYKKVDEINPVEARDKFHLDLALYNLGIAYQRAGSLDDALKLYQEAIQTNPEQTNAYCAKGEVLYQKNDYDSALESLTICRSMNPERKGINRFFSSIYQARGSEFIKQKNYTEARIEFNKAIALDPANETTYYYMGYLEYLEGNYKQALSQIDTIKGTEREDMKGALSSILYNIGGALQRDEKWEEAAVAFGLAVSLRKDDPEIYSHLGYNLMKARSYDKAVSAFKETLKLDPRHQKAAINLAIVAEIAVKSHLEAGEDYLRNNSYIEALREFNFVLSIDPGNKSGLEGKDGAEKGVEKLNKIAAEQRDNEISVRLQEAERFIAEGKVLPARKDFEAVLLLEPGNKNAMEGLGKTDEMTMEAKKKHADAAEKAFADGKYYRAGLEYRLVLEFDPENEAASEKMEISMRRLSEQISPLLAEARKAEDSNRFSEAAAAYNKILDLQPDNIEALKERPLVSERLEKAFNEALSNGREALKGGELVKAAENLGRALDLKPDNEIAIEEYANISGKLKKIIDSRLSDAASSLRSGRYGDAVANYKAALLLDGENKEAGAGLERSTKLRDETVEKRMAVGLKAYKERIYYQAVSSFNEVLQIDGGNTEAQKLQKEARARMEEQTGPWIRSGIDAYKKGDIDSAIVSFKKVLNVDPANREAKEYIGKTDARKAKASVEKEVEKHYLKGIELYTNGKFKDALDEWKRVIELDPKHEKAALNIEKAKRKMEGIMDTK